MPTPPTCASAHARRRTSRGKKASTSSPAPSAAGARTPARRSSPASRCRKSGCTTASSTTCWSSARTSSPTQPAADALPPLAGGVISDDTLWACTTCGYCEAACPIELEHLPRFFRMRQHRVMMDGEFPHELKAVFAAYESQSNPWGLPADARADWARGTWRADRHHARAGEGTGLPVLRRICRILRSARPEGRPRHRRHPARGRGQVRHSRHGRNVDGGMRSPRRQRNAVPAAGRRRWSAPSTGSASRGSSRATRMRSTRCATNTRSLAAATR